MTTSDTARRGKTFQDLVAEAKSRIPEITAEQLRQWQAEGKAFTLLDVREPHEYVNGHIQDAVNVPRGILELEIDDIVPNQDQVIVAYCGGGSRSALAADTLKTMGYNPVYSLTQGYRGWIQ